METPCGDAGEHRGPLTPEGMRVERRATRALRLLGRREFLAAGAVAATAAVNAGSDPPRRILLRSSWQTVNIGDIAHTPGLLAILERGLPGVEVTLWPSRIDDGVEELLRRRFPRLSIAAGRAALDAAFAECDMLLHGSGPSLVAERDVARWCDETGKPFGVYGITLPRTGSTSTAPRSEEVLRQTIRLLDRAKFVYFRDSVSLGLARDLGCTCPVMGLGPDGAFGTDLRDDASATAFLAAHRLEEGRFLCCIPRLRYTPYWEIPGSTKPFDSVKHARNEALKEHDHAPLRAAITAVIRETGLSVLVCPEDRTQMAVGRQLLVDPLPPDIRSHVVWREHYWLPDEALSVYMRSAGLFGNEMHSPIMCIGNGVPALVCRWAEQTSKGIMWRDIGLGDWLFDFDVEADVRRLPGVVLEVARDPAAARRKAAAARAEVERRTGEAMRVVAETLEQRA